MLKIRKTVDNQFLVRVIKNQVSSEENEFFEYWLSESEKNKEEFGNFLLLWNKFDNIQTPPVPNSSEQWQSLETRIHSANNQTVSLSSAQNFFIHKKNSDYNHSRLKSVRYSWIFSAAALLMITVAIGLLLQRNDSQKNSDVSKKTTTNHNQFYELISQRGERKTFPLADGTIVYLNSESKLIYPKVFSETSREVEITGEAYFSVISEKERVFKVTSGNTVTVVTGTEFNIRNRDDKVNVVVAKGSVKTYLKNSDEGIGLKRGQMVSYSKRDGFSKPVAVNLDQLLAWRSNKFSFNHAPLRQVIREIERYYNIDIVAGNDSLLNRKLTGVFKTDSLDQIFSVISMTLDVKIEYKGRRVIIN